MKIDFPDQPPAYDADQPALLFMAQVDGVPVRCAITAEALEDHFGAASMRDADLIGAYRAHRHAIETAAARMLASTGGQPVVLHSGYFRMYGDT